MSTTLHARSCVYSFQDNHAVHAKPKWVLRMVKELRGVWQVNVAPAWTEAIIFSNCLITVSGVLRFEALRMPIQQYIKVLQVYM